MRATGLIFLFFLFVWSSYAQTSVGIRGGYTTSSYSFRPTPASRAISVSGIGRPTFALVFEHFNAKNAGIEVNFQYVSIGFAQPNGETAPILTNETEFNYLKMPILSSFFLGKSGRFQIKIGPHFGYLLNAKDMGADFLITACPLCQYNLMQNSLSEKTPIYYFTELLAHALGLKEKECFK
jgi:hypothetical protein